MSHFSVQDIQPLDNILPQEPLLMMGAGPVPIPVPVARANSIVINHLGPTMSRVIDQVKKMARYVFETRSKWILGVAGPGSAAMEMAIVNLVSPGDAVLSVCNGYFSGRLSEMAERCGGEVHRYVDIVEVGGSKPPSPTSFASIATERRSRRAGVVRQIARAIWTHALKRVRPERGEQRPKGRCESNHHRPPASDALNLVANPQQNTEIFR